MSESKPDRSRQKLSGILGLLVVATIFALLCIAPGWFQHGLAALVAGCVGLFWILATVCLTRRITLLLMLCLVASIAMIMAGYRGILGTTIAKQRMVAMVEKAGGRVGFAPMPNRSGMMVFSPELGLIVPVPKGYRRSMTKINSLYIPQELFTEQNVRSWPLEESHVVIQCHSESDIVSAAALEALPKTCRGIGVERGRFDRRGTEALKRFKCLEVLYLPLHGQPIPKWVAELRDLTVLRLRDAKIRSQDSQRIAELPKLRYIYLFNSRINSIQFGSMPQRLPELRRISLIGCTVDSAMIYWCGTMLDTGKDYSRGFLEIAPSTFPDAWDKVSDPSVLEIRELDCFSGPLTDKQLMSMAEWPKLEEVMLEATNVTAAGVEEFQKARPDVEIEMR